jgi:phosphohistidine phosphatase
LQIHLLRHAIASLRRSGRSGDDRARRLTPEGREKMRIGAQGMRELGIAIDLALCSPLVRCRQTARIVVTRLRPRPTLRTLAALQPGVAPAELIHAIAQLPPSTSVLLVGHEPGLSSLASLLIAGPGAELAWVFKKGGLCRIDFPGTPQPGSGRLIYHLTPRILRRLGAHPT